jgi:hypothetical protein
MFAFKQTANSSDRTEQCSHLLNSVPCAVHLVAHSGIHNLVPSGIGGGPKGADVAFAGADPAAGGATTPGIASRARGAGMSGADLGILSETAILASTSGLQYVDSTDDARLLHKASGSHSHKCLLLPLTNIVHPRCNISATRGFFNISVITRRDQSSSTTSGLPIVCGIVWWVNKYESCCFSGVLKAYEKGLSNVPSHPSPSSFLS